MDKNFLRILVCPLDWGIGHATRCVPLIRQLQLKNHEVIIVADGKPLDFLREYFPELEFIRLPGVRVTYPKGKNMALKMIRRSPAILCGIIAEHRKINRIIQEYKADVVISDNRFGLWSKHAYSVYVTHQVMIKAPDKMKWARPLLYRMHKWIINHYQACWIPDLPGTGNLSGDLGHPDTLPGNAGYIGLLSRFDGSAKNEVTVETDKKPDLLVMLSGPEPQRSILENLVLNELTRHGHMNVVILQGIPGAPVRLSPLPGVTVYNHLNDADISTLIRNAGVILCRPGYSTIMDLAVLGRNAVLVPTPGQTEQEYLAGHLSSGGGFVRMEQDRFNLGLALEAGKRLPAKPRFRHDRSLLEARVTELPDKIHALTRINKNI